MITTIGQSGWQKTRLAMAAPVAPTTIFAREKTATCSSKLRRSGSTASKPRAVSAASIAASLTMWRRVELRRMISRGRAPSAGLAAHPGAHLGHRGLQSLCAEHAVADGVDRCSRSLNGT